MLENILKIFPKNEFVVIDNGTMETYEIYKTDFGVKHVRFKIPRPVKRPDERLDDKDIVDLIVEPPSDSNSNEKKHESTGETDAAPLKYKSNTDFITENMDQINSEISDEPKSKTTTDNARVEFKSSSNSLSKNTPASFNRPKTAYGRRGASFGRPATGIRRSSKPQKAVTPYKPRNVSAYSKYRNGIDCYMLKMFFFLCNIL